MAFRLHPTLETERAKFFQRRALGLFAEAGDASNELPLYIDSTGYVVADLWMGRAWTSPELEAEPAGNGKFYLKHVGPYRNGTYLSYWQKCLSLNIARSIPWSLRNGRLLAEGDPGLTLCRYFNQGGRYGVGTPSPLTHLGLEGRRALVQEGKKQLGLTLAAAAGPGAFQGVMDHLDDHHYSYDHSYDHSYSYDFPHDFPYHLQRQDPVLRRQQALDALLYPDAYPLYFPKATNPELHAAFGVEEDETEIHPDDQPEPDRMIHLVTSASFAAPAREKAQDPSWKQAPANIDLLAVSTLDNGLLLGVGTDLSLYTRTSVASVWVMVPSSGLVTGATQLRDGTIVGVGTDGALWARATLESDWAQVPSSGTVVAITQLQDETIVGVGTDGALWTRATLESDWVRVPSSETMISARGMADGTILGVGPDNRIYSRDTLDDDWVPMPDDREALAVADLPSGMLVAVGTDHKLYYTCTPRR